MVTRKIIDVQKEIICNIIDFWNKEKPHIIGPAKYCNFYKQAVILCIEDFLDNNENNFKNYPWVDKIFAKRKEIFGF